MAGMENVTVEEVPGLEAAVVLAVNGGRVRVAVDPERADSALVETLTAIYG